MDIFLICLFVLLIAAIVLVFKFVKHIVAAVLIALFLVFAVLCIVAYATYLDVMDIKDRASEKNLLLFENDKTVVFALEFTLKTDEGTSGQDNFVFVDNEQFDLNDIDYKQLHETYFKVIEIQQTVADGLFADEVIFPFGEDNATITMSKEDALTFMESETPIEDAVDFMVIQKGSTLNVSDVNEFKQNLTQNILSDVKSEDGFKGSLAGIFLATKVKENPAQTIKNVVLNYKKGNIKVDKKTILFGLIDMTPKAILNGVVDKFSEKIAISEEQSDDNSNGETKDVAI